MLIHQAELEGAILDVRLEDGRISAIAAHLAPRPGEAVVNAAGGALLPGLHDHHIHLISLAKALDSVSCGPPEVFSAEELVCRLRDRAQAGPADAAAWIRGIGYHESVAGDIDRFWLDRVVPDRPLRIQHRSGRLWILNSRALGRLGPDDGAGSPERAAGRFYDADTWLRERLGGDLPGLGQVSARLASYGVTGVTDTTPHNSLEEYGHFAAERARGHLRQDVLVMGSPLLDAAVDLDGIRRGPTKVHLHESELPPFDELCAVIRRSHAAGRPVAVHCVTVTELVFVTGAFAAVGAIAGDRIEHASVAPPEVLPLLVDQGLTVVTQPGFLRERGDVYWQTVAPGDLPWLYRGRAFLDAGIPLGGSTDAPFGDPNPWLAMAAAVRRCSGSGHVFGGDEALSPEEALALFTCHPQQVGREARTVTVGARADLCLLERPWSVAREELAAVRVAATFKDGELIHPV